MLQRLPMAKLILLLCSLSLFQLGNSQDARLLIRMLDAGVADGTMIKVGYKDYYHFDEDHRNHYEQHYLKYKGKLYMHPGGMGRLYEVQKTSDSTVSFTQVDKTTYWGYNYNCAAFVYNQNIYSFGGYGYWRTNGFLRKYNWVSNEWDLVPVNKEVPFANNENLWSFAFTNYPKNDKLYITQTTNSVEHLKIDAKNNAITYQHEVWELDLQTNDWKKLGFLNKKFTEKINLIYYIATTKIGTIFRYGKEIYLFQPGNATLKQLKKDSYLQSLLDKSSEKFLFSTDSMIIYGSFKNKFIDSFKISEKEFEPSQVVFYQKENSIILSIATYASSLVLVLLIAFYFYRKRKQSTTINQDKTTLQYSFDERELAALQLIVENSENQIDTSIEQLNQVLGLERKNIDVQKKQRSDVLISINSKLGLLLHTKDQLIQKKRVETDKRSFCYFIAPENIQMVKALIG